ncbi:MAG: cobalamin-binding protein [Planctomycetota bacterium]|nr:MAG: cobalamin-binding protein [Planctomycetota bacterium]
MRIVSLLPSATEIVCELGLGGALVGVSHECDYPAAVRSLPRVTRSLLPADASSGKIDELVRERLRSQRALYELDREVLSRLAPDLIVTQGLCDVCAVAEAEVTAAACLLPGSPRVINLEPQSLAQVLISLQTVADAAGVPEVGRATVARLQARIDAVAIRSATVALPPRVVLLEWIDPPFSSGHWSPEIVRLAGGREVLGREGEKSRTLSWSEVVVADPEVLVIACCGFDIPRSRQDLPMLAAQPGFRDLTCVRNQRLFLVDGNESFSRPGPRLVESLEILAQALHPGLHPLPVGIRPAERLTAAELLSARG